MPRGKGARAQEEPGNKRQLYLKGVESICEQILSELLEEGYVASIDERISTSPSPPRKSEHLVEQSDCQMTVTARRP